MREDGRRDAAGVHARSRDANDAIEVEAGATGATGAVEFVCECADADCAATVSLTLEEYETVRRHPRRFFTAPDHEGRVAEGGVTVVRLQAFAVVELRRATHDPARSSG